jgi:hypothetical protein
MSQNPRLPLRLAGAGILFGTCLLPIFARRSRLPAALAMLWLLLAILPITGCGGGSSSKPPGAQTVVPGTYQLVVTAMAGSAKATETLTLIVE